MSEKSIYPRSSAGGVLFWGLVTGGRPAVVLLIGIVAGAALANLTYQPGIRVETSGPAPRAAAVPVPVVQESIAPKLDIPLPGGPGRPERRGGLLDQARRVEDFQEKCRRDPQALELRKLRADMDSTVALGASVQVVVARASRDARGTSEWLAGLHLPKEDRILTGISVACWSIGQPAEAMQWAMDSDDPMLLKYTFVAYWRANREGMLKLLPKLRAEQMDVIIWPLVVAKPRLVSAERWEILGAIQALPKPLSKNLNGFEIAFLNQEAELDAGKVEDYLKKSGMSDDDRSTVLPSLALGHGKGNWVAANEWLLDNQSDEMTGAVMLLWRQWAEADRTSFEKAMEDAPPSQEEKMERVLRALRGLGKGAR